MPMRARTIGDRGTVPLSPHGVAVVKGTLDLNAHAGADHWGQRDSPSVPCLAWWPKAMRTCVRHGRLRPSQAVAPDCGPGRGQAGADGEAGSAGAGAGA